MKLKQWQNKFQVIVNANSIVQHVFQIKNKTNVNVDIIVSAKKNIVEILTDVFVKIENI